MDWNECPVCEGEGFLENEGCPACLMTGEASPQEVVQALMGLIQKLTAEQAKLLERVAEIEERLEHRDPEDE